MNNIVIGKRIPLGAAIQGVATALAAIYKEHSVAIMAVAIPVTMIAQVVWVNHFGITQPDKK